MGSLAFLKASMRVFTSLITSLLLASSICSADGVAHTGPTKSFFERDSARSVFTAEAALKDPETIFGYFQPTSQKSKGEVSPEQEDSVVAKKAKATSKEDLIKKFGDPSDEDPLLAKDDAPTPIRAMFEAYELGETDLAEAYAERYARYLNGLSERNAEVGHLISKKMKGAKKDDLIKNLAAQSSDEEGLIRAENLMESLQDSARVGDQQKKVRTDYRKVIKELNIPSSATGLLEIVFIFDPASGQSQVMAAQLVQSLNGMRSELGQISVIGLVKPGTSKSQIADFKRESGFTFNIGSAGKVLQQNPDLNLPSTIFSPLDSGRSHLEEGMRTSIYLEELLKHLREKD
jgi:hypothetical protein